MLSSLFTTSIISEWFCFFAAIFLLNKKTGIWRLFIPFLALTLIVETSGWYIRYVLGLQQNYWVFGIKNNHWIFTGRSFISSPFFIFMLLQAKQLAAFKKLGRTLTVIFYAFAIANILFIQKVTKYDSYTEELGCLICVYLCCRLFFNTISDADSNNLLAYEYFWFANGLLFYSLGSATIYLLFDTLSYENAMNNVHLFTNIIDILNPLLYGSLIIAFICRRKNSN